MKKITISLLIAITVCGSFSVEAKTKKNAEDTANLVSEPVAAPVTAPVDTPSEVVKKPRIRIKAQAPVAIETVAEPVKAEAPAKVGTPTVEAKGEMKSSEELLNNLKGSISTEAVKAPAVTLSETTSNESREALFFKGENENAKSTEKTPAREGNLPWVKTFLSFFAVSSLIMVLAYFLKGKTKAGKSFRSILSGQQDGLRIVQTLSVGQKRQIVLVEYKGVELVVGMTPNAISTLHSTAVNRAAEIDGTRTQRIDLTPSINQAPTLSPYVPTPILQASALDAPVTHTAGENANLSDKIREAVKKLKPLGALQANAQTAGGERTYGTLINHHI